MGKTADEKEKRKQMMDSIMTAAYQSDVDGSLQQRLNSVYGDYANSNTLAQRKADADAQAKAANDAYWADQYAKSQPQVAIAKGAINAAAGAAMGANVNPDTLGKYSGGSGGGSGDGDGGLGSYARAYASFAPSQTYLKAMEYTQSLLDQLSSGRTSYTDRVNEMLKSIENKEPFSYDMNSDMLFQNALASAMNSGQLAMQDTMGQAAALTGGYGSTYSQAVGNQAYNDMIQGAYDQLPEFYQLARDTYDKDLQQLYDKLDMYNTADAIEYERLANAYGANAEAAARLYDQEYNNYWQTQNFNEDSRRWAAEMGYKASQAKQSQDNWEREYELELAQADAKANELKDPSETQMTRAENAYNEGGLDALYAYLAKLPDNVNVDLIMKTIVGTEDEVGIGRLPYDMRTYTKSGKDTPNILDPFGWTIDADDTVKDQYDEEIRLDALVKQLVATGRMTDSEARAFVKKYNKY